MLVIPLAVRLAPAMGLIDVPDPRKVHKMPVPRVGGWGIALGALAPLLLLFELDPLLQSFVAGVIVLFLFGVWDDARQLGHWPKFIGQALAVGLVVFHGGLHVSRLPFVPDLAFPQIAGQVFTAFAMIGAINAINHSDGLDGLAAGEVLLSLVAIAVLGHRADSALVVGIALATMGGTLGFLRYNTHPAQVFMGDGGSQVLGFSLAFLVVYLSQVANPAASAFVPVLLLGLPIADILVVLYKRASGGMNWFKATRNHVHHRLLDLGFTHFESVVCIYSLQSVLVLAAVLLAYESDYLLAGIFLLVLLLLFGGLLLAEAFNWRRSGQSRARKLDRLFAALDPRVLRVPTLWFIAAVVLALLVIPAAWARSVPRDIGILSAILAPLLCLALLPWKMAPLVSTTIVRTITYVGAACVVFVLTQYPGAGAAQALGGTSIVIAALAVAIGLFARFLSGQRFETTPTDYLVALGLIVLAVMDNPQVETGDMRRFATYLIVLFYGCEVIFAHVKSWRVSLGVPAFAALSVLAYRGLFAPV